MTVFKYAMRRGFTSPASLILNCAMPLILIIWNGNIDPETGGIFGTAIFMTAMMIMFGAFMMARSIQLDKLDGTIVRILAGPVTMRSYLVQNFFSAMIPMTVLSAIIAAVGVLLHSWEISFAVGLALCYALLAATSIGLSFVWSCLFKDKEASVAVFSVLITLMATLGGLMIPISIMPDMMRRIGMVFPAHWAARGVYVLASHGMNGEYWLSLLAMFLFTVAFLLYGGKRRLI